MIKKVMYVIIAIFCLFAIIGLGGCTTEKRQHQNAIEGIKRITEIEVPSDSDLIFNYADNSFGPGRHEHFVVFEFEKEPIDWLEEEKFLKSDDETKSEEGDYTLVIENISAFWQYFKNETKNGQKVPNEYVPDFKIDYLWIRTQNVYFFYYPDTLRLVVYIAWG